MNNRTKVVLVTGLAMLVALIGFFPMQTAFADTTTGGTNNFLGVITSLPGTPNQVGDWKVGMRTVHVISATQIITINGPVAVGSFVEVMGVPQNDGSLNAVRIVVLAGPNHPDLHVQFRGVVKSLPADPHNGDWVVTTHLMTSTVNTPIDVTVHVSATTRIIVRDGVTLTVGSEVKVDGLVLPDKSVRAGEIEILGTPTIGKPIQFFGVITQLPVSGTVGIWKVGMFTVNVSTTTQIDNPGGKPIKVGDFAHVEGIVMPNGSVNARHIEIHHFNTTPPPTHYIKFYGLVTQVPATPNHVGDWKVNGITVHVSTTTQIVLLGSTFPSVPFRAEVKGILNPDKSVNALQIVIDNKNAVTPASGLGSATAVAHGDQ